MIVLVKYKKLWQLLGNKEDNMRLSYNKLWKLLIDKNLNKRRLQQMTGISPNCVAKLGRGENLNTDTLLRICIALDCDIGDIVEVVRDTPTSVSQE